MKYIVIVLLLCSFSEVHAAVVGWNNDGSGDYGRECKPPLTFDGEKGINLRWKAALPNWSNSSPIVIEPVDGKGAARVVCLAEPLDCSPILLCFDADTGKELWRWELDAVAAMPKEQQGEARALAKKCWARQRAFKKLCVDAGEVYERRRAEWESLPIFERNGNGYTPEECRKLPSELQPFLKRAEEIGCCFTGLTPSWAGRWWLFSFRKNAAYDRECQRLAQLGLMWSKWDSSGAWDGVAYPTPLSDGKHILTVTAHNLYSCHDLDGKILWHARFPPPKESDFTPEQISYVAKIGKKRLSLGLDGCQTSPLLVDGVLISNIAGMIRAIDIKTGQCRWTCPVVGRLSQGMAVPAVATVGSERYIIGVNGDYGFGSDPIVRLRDGVPAGSLPGSVMLNGPVMLQSDLV
jgi:outer membrane protein assembly factor BamB